MFNQWYTTGARFCLSLSSTMRYCITFGGIAVLVTLWLFLVYFPLEQSIRTYYSNSATQSESLFHIKKALKQTEQLRHTITQLQTASAGMQESCSLFLYLDTAHESQLKTIDCYQSEQTIQLTTQGSLAALIQYLHALTNKKYSHVCTKCSIQLQSPQLFTMNCAFSHLKK